MRQIAKEVLSVAIILQLLLESFSHRSLIHGMMTPLINPLMFICSVFLLSTFLSIGLFMPKRHFGYLLTGFVWFWLGLTDFILLSFRTTPLTATDFKMLTSVVTVIGRYLNHFQMALVGVVFFMFILILIGLCIKMPYTKIKLGRSVLAIGLSFILMFGSFHVALQAKAVSTNFGNIAHAFADYGFAYSFSTSVIDKGIKEPKSYSKEKVCDVLDAISAKNPTSAMSLLGLRPLNLKVVAEDTETATGGSSVPELVIDDGNTQKSPNIVFIQLESYFDVKRLKAFEFDKDPTPNITALRENYSSGYLTVPSIGAGTANTEFEVVSGMSLDYFGAGEYPYKTILKKSTVESYPFVLTDLGYHSHAIHNNMGTFYARHSVYPRFGFDSFSSIEYMNDVEYSPTGWAKDSILIPEITKALEATAEPDFVFAVSVQPHGKYPDERILENPVIIPKVVSPLPEMINEDNDTTGSEQSESTNSIETKGENTAHDDTSNTDDIDVAAGDNGDASSDLPPLDIKTS